MNLLIGFLPALLWGISPIVSTKTGGKPINQMLGAGYGQFIIGIICFLIFRPAINLTDFIWCFLGGAAWSIAQLTQFMSFRKLNVSRAMPISTGLQIIEATLAGVIFWGDWGTLMEKLIGFVSIILLILGISFTSVHDRTPINQHLDYRSGLWLLFVGSFGYTACSVFPKIPNVNGITGTLPQGFGMFAGALLIGSLYQLKHHQSIIFSKKTWENLTYGFFGALGGIFYMTSLKLNGAANAFPLTQLNVVVSTLGGVIFLHERKDHKELSFTVAGLVVIMIAAFMIARLSQ